MHFRRPEERKHRDRLVARLHLHHREVDGPAVDAWGCSGLEAAHRKFELAQPRGKADRGRIPCPAGLVLRQADMDEPGKKGPGCQHYRAAGEAHPELSHHSGHSVARQYQVVHRLLKQGEIGLVLQPRANRVLVQQAVGLGASRADSRSFRGIEHTELDPSFIGGDRHGSAQGVDFLDHVPLADAADGGVTRHLAERFDAVRQEKRLAASASGGERGLGAGMAAADYDHVKSSRKMHRLGKRTQVRF